MNGYKAMRVKFGKMTFLEAVMATGLSKGLLSKLETGTNNNPTLKTLRALVTAYGCAIIIEARHSIRLERTSARRVDL